MLSFGTWFFKSKEDPRWNNTGRDLVGMFCRWGDVPSAKNLYELNAAKYGKAPADLVFGYMKD